jgi:Ca2+-binding EF-hand superfamily protein
MMISGIGGGMPNMQAMQQRLFNKADGDASGSIDSAEFSTMLKNSPMGDVSAKAGVDSTQVFGQLDTDQSGSISQAELDSGMQQRVQQMQSTVAAFGGGQNSSGSSEQDTLQTLLKALDNGAADTKKGNDLSGTMRALMERMGNQLNSAYSAGGMPQLSLQA